MTPNEMANQLVTAGRSLIAVLDEESAALTEARIKRVAELHEEKESAAVSYECIVHKLSKHPGLFDHASLSTRQALTGMKEALDTASIRNINALRAALEMNRRLVQAIATSVNRQRISASGYTKTGAAYAGAQSPLGAETVPVSLNETL